ncbi:hypothetical protein PENTCL1PPCAC_20649, partial [Pristionchus entomophagus]
SATVTMGMSRRAESNQAGSISDVYYFHLKADLFMGGILIGLSIIGCAVWYVVYRIRRACKRCFAHGNRDQVAKTSLSVKNRADPKSLPLVNPKEKVIRWKVEGV